MADGTINQLNFKVILEDKDFESKLKSLQSIANAFNTSMTQALTISKARNVTKDTQDLAKALKDATKEQGNLNKAINGIPSSKIKSYLGSVRQVNAQLINSENLLRTVSQLSGITFGAVGVRQFLSSLVDITGEFEVQKMALTSMLQDADKANQLFKDLRANALNSPYTFQDLSKYAKQLTAFNIDANQLVETESMLADVAAGLGVDVGRIILAYGQIKSAGILKGTELRQLTEAGVPILDSLSKQIEAATGKAVQLSEIFSMISKRQISFDMVNQAFREMTSEGGKFYKMQEVLVETLQGKIGKLRDAWQQALYDMGTANDGVLKGGVDLAIRFVQNLDKIGIAFSGIIKAAAAYGAVLAIVAVRQKAVAGFDAIRDFLQLTKGIKSAKDAMLALELSTKGAALSLGALFAAGVVIYEIGKAISKAAGEMSKFRKHLDEIHESANDNTYNESIQTIKHLRSVLEDVNKSYADRKAALDQLKIIEPSYHADLTEEGRLINNNVSALDRYIQKLEDSARAKAYEEELIELYKERNKVEKEQEKMAKDYEKFNSSPAPGFFVPKGKSVLENALTRTAYKNTSNQLKEIDDRISDITKKMADLNQEGENGTGVARTLSNIKDEINSTTKAISKLEEKAKSSGLTLEETKQLTEERGALKKLKEEYELYTGVKYDKEQHAIETQSEKDRKERIADIKNEIQVLQKYKQVYEGFVSLVGPEMAQSLMNDKVFKGANISNFNFAEQIEDLVDALRDLGDTNSADSILASLGLGEDQKLQKKLKEVQQTAKTYRSLVEAWTAKDTDADDDSFFGRITKIVSDLNTKSNELFLKFKKGKELFRGIDAADPTQRRAVIQGLMDEGLTEEAANEFWETFVEKGEEALGELYVKNLAKLKTNAQQSVNSLASTWVKEQTKDLSLTDWGDKSIGQVRELYKTLKELAEGEGIDDKMKEKLNATGLAIEDFTKLTKSELSELTAEAKKELIKKFGAALKQLASDLSSTAEAIKDFAEAAGKEGLADAAENLQKVIPIWSSMVERMAQGDWAGAIVAGVTGVAKRMFQAATEAAKFNAQLREAREESRKLRYETALSQGVDSIFGGNTLKSIKNAVEVLDKLQASMKNRQKSDLGKWTVKTLAWMAEGIGRELYDSFGNLNAETLRAILDTYDDLKRSGREWIQQAINDSEEYTKAMEQLDSTIESIVGDIASSAADTLVDGWIEASKAALDYADIIDDVAQSYAKMVIKSMIIDDILNDDAVQQLKKAFVSGDAGSAMSLIESKLQEIADLEPVFQQVLETFDPYFKREEAERTASSKALASSFSQDTIDYWSGQLTLLVEYARRGDEQREMIAGLVMALKDNMAGGGGGNYTSNVQTYLATIQGDTTAIRGDIYAMKLAIQNMNDKGVKML